MSCSSCASCSSDSPSACRLRSSIARRSASSRSCYVLRRPRRYSVREFISCVLAYCVAAFATDWALIVLYFCCSSFVFVVYIVTASSYARCRSSFSFSRFFASAVQRTIISESCFYFLDRSLRRESPVTFSFSCCSYCSSSFLYATSRSCCSTSHCACVCLRHISNSHVAVFWTAFRFMLNSSISFCIFWSEQVQFENKRPHQ